jgi:hypothetical protein
MERFTWEIETEAQNPRLISGLKKIDEFKGALDRTLKGLKASL